MADEKIEILREIRDRQKEALELQREQFDFIKKQYDRAEAIQDKAEKLQDRASVAAKIIIPIIVIALAILLCIIYMDFV